MFSQIIVQPTAQSLLLHTINICCLFTFVSFLLKLSHLSSLRSLMVSLLRHTELLWRLPLPARYELQMYRVGIERTLI